MKNNTEANLILKGVIKHAPFENVFLKDAWQMKKDDGDEAGAKKILKIYKSLKENYETKMEAW